METEEPAKIELRSDEVQEVLNHIPSGLVRWGTTVFLCIVVLMMILTHFIHYPDIVSARVTLLTGNPPVHVISRASGPIKLLVKDKSHVTSKTLLSIVSNPASLEDIQALSNWMDAVKPKIYVPSLQLNQIHFLSSLTLGEVQSSYQAFRSSVEEARLFESLALFDRQRITLTENVAHYQELNKELDVQHQLVGEELELSRIKYQDDSSLYATSVISKREMFLAKTAYLQDKRSREDIVLLKVQNSIKVNELKSKSEELLLTKKGEIERFSLRIQNAYEKLEVDVNTWKQKYLLISPIAGKVSFSKFWSDNQFVSDQEEVMTVVPGKQTIIGKVELPIAGSGKVKVGQRVKVKLENYPYNEYGMIMGRVESIAPVPVNNSYSISISIPQGMVSTYHKKLVFGQEMKGVAEIITEDKTLSERILYQLIKLVK